LFRSEARHVNGGILGPTLSPPLEMTLGARGGSVLERARFTGQQEHCMGRERHGFDLERFEATTLR